MARTHKDKPNYPTDKKRSKEKLSDGYYRHKNREDENWEIPVIHRSTHESSYYKCVERKLPLYMNDFDWAEGLIDHMDSLNDKKNDAA